MIFWIGVAVALAVIGLLLMLWANHYWKKQGKDQT